MKPDRHGRTVSYLRLSITDRCNLRCRYCGWGKDTEYIPHDSILTYEELLQLIGLAQRLGVSKVRLTGGEPMVRRGFMDFLGRAYSEHPDVDFRLTTNGTLLEGKVPALKAMGMQRINLSLDTLRRDVFQKLVGVDAFESVRNALDECLEHGLRVKLNVVALKGINEADIPGFMKLATEAPIDIRFIEFMPIGEATAWEERSYWPMKSILEHIERHVTLEPLSTHERTGGPARMYAIKGGKGRIGMISALSDHFCLTCNRLRVTSNGKLRTCLFSDKEYRLRAILRHPKLGIEQVARVIERAYQRKPIGAELLAAMARKQVAGSGMSRIGG